MNNQEARDFVLECLDSIGIYLTPEETTKDLDLREYLENSLQFISFIINIENQLNIEVPDDFLLYDRISSLNAYCEMLSALEY